MQKVMHIASSGGAALVIFRFLNVCWPCDGHSIMKLPAANKNSAWIRWMSRHRVMSFREVYLFLFYSIASVFEWWSQLWPTFPLCATRFWTLIWCVVLCIVIWAWMSRTASLRYFLDIQKHTLTDTKPELQQEVSVWQSLQGCVFQHSWDTNTDMQVVSNTVVEATAHMLHDSQLVCFFLSLCCEEVTRQQVKRGSDFLGDHNSAHIQSVLDSQSSTPCCQIQLGHAWHTFHQVTLLVNVIARFDPDIGLPFGSWPEIQWLLACSSIERSPVLYTRPTFPNINP